MWYAVDIYDTKGKVVGNVALKETLFSDDLINKDLIQEFYLLQRSNARINIADSKTRAEVAGSGKKIYRQKGTGSARAGEKRSPTRVHGGVAFGPKAERNFKKDMNKKAKKVALYGLLTMKAKDKEILGLQGELKAPKTKDALSILKNLGLDNKKTLVVLNEKNDAITKSFRNIAKVKYILVNYLNPEDVLNCDKIVIREDALQTINK